MRALFLAWALALGLLPFASRGEPTGAEKLYLFHLDIHGRHQSSEPLVFDQDTGGQNVYVNDLVRALANNPQVRKVEVATRLLRGDDWFGKPLSPIHSLESEPIPGAPNARNVRFSIADDKYRHKEELWPYLDAFAEQVIGYLKQQPKLPDAIHAHYADAGYVGRIVSQRLGIPLIFTGHSLGINKLQSLRQGPNAPSDDALDAKFQFRDRRFPAELGAAFHGDLVITNSAFEISQQWRNYSPFQTRMEAIPPGVDAGKYYPWTRTSREESAAPFRDAFARLKHPNLPPVLSIARNDPKKNLPGLIEAFAANEYLRQYTNLIIATSADPKAVKELIDLAQARGISDHLLLLDGSVPNLPELYRLAGHRKGVFVNPAFHEPFGLTVLEAAASGVPVVATANGGPPEILGKLQSGKIVDPKDPKAIGDAIQYLIEDPKRWGEYSRRGLENFEKAYSWKAHAERYVGLVRELKQPGPKAQVPGRRFFVYDVEHGDPNVLAAFYHDRARGQDVALVVTSGLSYEQTHHEMKALGVHGAADVVVADHGKDVRFGSERIPLKLGAEVSSSSQALAVLGQRFSFRPELCCEGQRPRIFPAYRHDPIVSRFRPQDILVLDFDDVLARSVDPIGMEQAEPVIRAKYEKELLAEGVPPSEVKARAYEKWKTVNFEARRHVRVAPVEAGFIDAVNRHIEGGGAVLVLSSRYPNWSLLTQKQALAVGLNLDGARNRQNLARVFGAASPASPFLLAGERPKGEVLAELLKAAPPPAGTKVHFVDDRLGHLLKMEDLLKGMPIELHHYRGAEKFHGSFDEGLMLRQLDHFTRFGTLPAEGDCGGYRRVANR